MAGTAAAGRSIVLGFAALCSVDAYAAEPITPYQFRVVGSLPLQSIESVTLTSRQNSFSYAPFLGVSASAVLAPDLTASLLASGGHDPPGVFRDGDSTLASFGGSLVKRWGAFSAGASVEHTYFYGDSFGTLNNIANDVNFFTRYAFRPGNDLRITPQATATARFDDALVMQRTTFSFRVEIEQRLVDRWWLIARPRIRYSNYVGDEAGRRDVTVSLVSGVKYVFTENVSFAMLAGVENRSSNVPARNRDRYVVGASLDFEFSPKLPW